MSCLLCIKDIMNPLDEPQTLNLTASLIDNAQQTAELIHLVFFERCRVVKAAQKIALQKPS